MRYLNWDVLLFPGPSKVPVQEFKTACHVVHDSEPLSIETSSGLENSRQIPIVSCFVENYPEDHPFKVSVHTWDIPRLSKRVKSQIELTGDCTACWEARVVIDGVCVGSALFTIETEFPKQIVLSFKQDEDGDDDLLRWPVFHDEMLMNNYWDPGENLGRIKVTISEGYAIGKVQLASFVRTENLVTFSYQHAPMFILETSAIAWPNPGMWIPLSQNSYDPASQSGSYDSIDPNLRTYSSGHSLHTMPRERLAISAPAALQPLSSNSMPPPNLTSPFPQSGLPRWTADNAEDVMPDPFIEHHIGPRGSDIGLFNRPLLFSPASTRRRNANSDDSKTTAPSAYSTREPNFEDSINFADSPLHSSSGLTAPTNSRIHSAENTPTIQDWSSRQMLPSISLLNSSYSTNSTTNPTDKPYYINLADMTDACRDFDACLKSEPAEEHEHTNSGNRHKPSCRPAANIKSKKEGRTAMLEAIASGRKLSLPAGSVRSAAGIVPGPISSRSVTDSKRKRTRAASVMKKPLDGHESEMEQRPPSPRKVSKTNGDEEAAGQDEVSPETALAIALANAANRQPLSAMDNSA